LEGEALREALEAAPASLPDKELRMHVQGFKPIGDLLVHEWHGGPSSCGDIEDGISVRFEKIVQHKENGRLVGIPVGTYGFVLDWGDFERTYKILSNLREARRKEKA